MRRTETSEQAANSGSSNLMPREPGIGRAEILRKYWELANLDPEVTKGTITGQLKALDSLCEQLDLEESGDDSLPTKPQQQIYRSAWLRDPARDPAGETSSGEQAGARPAASRRASPSRIRTKAASKRAVSAADDE